MGRQLISRTLPLALLSAALWSLPAIAQTPGQPGYGNNGNNGGYGNYNAPPQPGQGYYQRPPANYRQGSPLPGTVNYVEGQVTVNGRRVSRRNIGNVAAAEGNVVATQRGKAEILLTPGVVLRLGDNSQARMDSESLTNTRVTLLSGEAIVEADQIIPENHVVIAEGNGTTTLLKNGLYQFSAVGPSASVYKGEATVDVAGRNVRLKEGHQLILSDARLKTHKFNTSAEDELYAWSRVRSQYEAGASAQEASILVPGGPGWYGAGWYWDPWFDGFAFVPAAGFFYGPFGFPFYSPYYAGYFGTGFYGGHWGRAGFYGHGAYGHGPAVAHVGGGMRTGGFGGGMHAGGFGGGGGRR